MNLKQRKLTGIRSWIKGREESYHLNRLRENGIDIDKELDKLTANQATAILSLLAGTYAKGCEDTRKTFMSIRNRRPVPTGCALRIVS